MHTQALRTKLLMDPKGPDSETDSVNFSPAKESNRPPPLDSLNSSPAKGTADSDGSSPTKDPRSALAAARRKNKMLQMMLDSAQAELEELRNSDDLNRTV